MIAFDAIDMTTRSYFEDDQVGKSLKGVFITAALLHFYDGFIWRVRESDRRSNLGIAGGAAGRAGRYGCGPPGTGSASRRQDPARSSTCGES